MAVDWDPQSIRDKKASRRLPVLRSIHTSRLGPALAAGGLLVIAGALVYGTRQDAGLEDARPTASPDLVSTQPETKPQPAAPERPRPTTRPYAVPSTPSRTGGQRPARPADYAPKVDGRILASVPAGSRPGAGPEVGGPPRPVTQAKMKPGLVPLSPEQQARAKKNMEAFEAEYRQKKLAEVARRAEESMRAHKVEARKRDGAREDVQLDGRPGDVPALTAAQLTTVDQALAEIKAQQQRGEALPAPLAKVLEQHGWEGLRRAAIREMAKHPEGAK